MNSQDLRNFAVSALHYWKKKNFRVFYDFFKNSLTQYSQDKVELLKQATTIINIKVASDLTPITFQLVIVSSALPILYAAVRSLD